jgi:lysophospholipase
MATFADLDELTAPDGTRLVLRRETTAAGPRAALILVHGWGEHAGRYAHVAAWLAARGIAVYALDQRGAGRSRGPKGHVARFAQYLADIVALRRLVAAEAPGPLLLLGHSNGGLITLRYLETAPEGVTGAVITSPFLALAFAPPRWKNVLATLLADLTPGLRVPTGVDLNTLATDPAVVTAARSDPWCAQVISPRAWREIRDAQAQVVAEGHRIGVPLFIGLAGDDRIASTSAARAFAAALRGDVTVREYPAMYHEILNDRDRERVLADIGAWLDRVLGAP